MPAFIFFYFLTPERHRNISLLAFSWVFYAWWRVDFLALLVASTAFTFGIGRLMHMSGHATSRERRWMLLGMAGNLGALCCFKYANFLIWNVNAVREAIGNGAIGWDPIVLPIGLSFYVMQSVSYLADIRAGTVQPSKSFLQYAAYKAMFAQLISGPIVRYAEIAQELGHRCLSLRQFGEGAETFMTGFGMKIIIADTLSPMVAAIYDGLPDPSFGDSWLGAIGYTLQLYFDFAGYSLMAIGLARMTGFHFPRNFNHPYLAGSCQEFWQRWHITLSRLLRDYLYFNLGGSRTGPGRTYVNLMIVMAIGGLWHGASWNFVVWGVWHGSLLCLHRLWSRMSCYRPMPYWLGNLLTMLATILGRVVFRAVDFATAVRLYAAMFGRHGFGGLSEDVAWQISPEQLWCVPIAIAIVYLPLIRGDRHAVWSPPSARTDGPWLRSFVQTAGPLLGYALSIVLLYSRAAVPFLYFQF